MIEQSNTADDGYISNFLIHWCGRGTSVQEQVSILSNIATSCRLLLSPNPFFFDGGLEIRENMICFTDVPLRHSAQHCAKYSRFGIAFKKPRLMNKGAQPVQYISHTFKRDLSIVYRYLMKELEKQTLDDKVFRAFHRHFFYMQEFSEGRADAKDAHYYEREWRLGEFTLVPDGESKGMFSIENRIGPYFGDLVQMNGKNYFQFELEDIAFLISPGDAIRSLVNPHEFDVRAFEELVRDFRETV